MSQGDRICIPPTWLLLDNQSTVDVFANGDMLEDIHQVDDQMVIASNGGSNVTSEMGVLPGYGPVWYDPIGIANIVSLSRVREKYHVSFNSDQNIFVVTKPDGTVSISSNSLRADCTTMTWTRTSAVVPSWLIL